MRSRFLRLWTRKRWRDEDTRDALEGPIPAGTEAFPFDAPLGSRSTLTFIGHIIVLSLPSLGIAYLGYFDRLAIVLLGIGMALSLATALYEVQTAGRSIHIDEHGIRLRRLLSSVDIPWWRIRSVETDRQLASLRIITEAGVVRMGMSSQAVEARKRLAFALRARTEPRHIPFVSMSSRWFSFSPGTTTLNVGAAMLVFAAVTLTASNTSWTLGIRCSAASEYLRVRFGDAADQPGCIVLRVSAAAERAGIRQGDLVIEMNHYAITSGAQFSAAFNRSGTYYSVTVLRPGTPEPIHFDFDTLHPGKKPITPQGDPLLYFLRARSSAAAGQIPGPIADYTKAIEIEPHFDLAYLYRGQLYELEGAQAEAFTDYDTAFRLSPRLGEVQREMAYVYQNKARQAEAVIAARAAIEFDGCDKMSTQFNVDCARDYNTLAEMLPATQYRSIAQAADRAIEFDPEFGKPYFLAAQAYAALGDRTKLAERARSYGSLPHSEIEPARVTFLDYFLAHADLPWEPPTDSETPTPPEP